eukprot:4325993-Prymnesium_polylepis.1
MPSEVDRIRPPSNAEPVALAGRRDDTGVVAFLERRQLGRRGVGDVDAADAPRDRRAADGGFGERFARGQRHL